MRTSKSVTVTDWGLPDYVKSQFLLQPNQLNIAINLQKLDGTLIEGPGFHLAVDNLFTQSRPVGIWTQKINASVKAEFSGSFDGQHVYLAVNDSYEAFLINPEDFTDTLEIFPVMQQKNGWVSSTVAENYCLVTGWKRNSLNRATNEDALWIRKGTTGGNFQYSSDNGSTWSGDQAISASGTSFSITVNSVSTTLTVYFHASTLASLGATDYFKWQVLGSGTYDRLSVDNRKAMHMWTRESSYDYFGEQLVFSWYNVPFYCDPLGGLASVGYELFYGVTVKNYFNHLVIGQYATAQNVDDFMFTEPDYQYQVGWSDLSQIHDFYAVQANEADVYLLRQNGSIIGEEAGILSMSLLNDKLFIFTIDTIYEMTYVGLPLVMQFRPLTVNAYCGSYNATVETNRGIAIGCTDGRIRLFDGVKAVEFDPGQRFEPLSTAPVTDFVSTYSRYRFPYYLSLYFNKYTDTLFVRNSSLNGINSNLSKYDFNNPGWFILTSTLSAIVTTTPYNSISTLCNGLCNVIGDKTSVLFLHTDGIAAMVKRASDNNLPFSTVSNKTSTSSIFTWFINFDDFDIKELVEVLCGYTGTLSLMQLTLAAFNSGLSPSLVAGFDGNTSEAPARFSTKLMAGSSFELQLLLVRSNSTDTLDISKTEVRYRGPNRDVEK